MAYEHNKTITLSRDISDQIIDEKLKYYFTGLGVLDQLNTLK